MQQAEAAFAPLQGTLDPGHQGLHLQHLILILPLHPEMGAGIGFDGQRPEIGAGERRHRIQAAIEIVGFKPGFGMGEVVGLDRLAGIARAWRWPSRPPPKVSMTSVPRSSANPTGPV